MDQQVAYPGEDPGLLTAFAPFECLFGDAAIELVLLDQIADGVDESLLERDGFGDVAAKIEAELTIDFSQARQCADESVDLVEDDDGLNGLGQRSGLLLIQLGSLGVEFLSDGQGMEAEDDQVGKFGRVDGEQVLQQAGRDRIRARIVVAEIAQADDDVELLHLSFKLFLLHDVISLFVWGHWRSKIRSAVAIYVKVNCYFVNDVEK